MEVKSIRRETLEEIIQFLKEFIIYCNRCPAKIQSDDGCPYVSYVILRFCNILIFNIKSLLHITYNLIENQRE